MQSIRDQTLSGPPKIFETVDHFKAGPIRNKCARALSTFPGQHHPVPYSEADRVKALLTRSSDEIERFQRESFPFPGEHDSIAYC